MSKRHTLYCSDQEQLGTFCVQYNCSQIKLKSYDFLRNRSRSAAFQTSVCFLSWTFYLNSARHKHKMYNFVHEVEFDLHRPNADIKCTVQIGLNILYFTHVLDILLYNVDRIDQH